MYQHSWGFMQIPTKEHVVTDILRSERNVVDWRRHQRVTCSYFKSHRIMKKLK